ncbi:ABC transporter substrate-binding protein [Simiduia sp. 21SJ11W-1]|uniref:ABC transporter substrate-binding protein n=1 Tax=Simiduia sp. 21SJ11W-1 TaxID=2909669 RepID=UPI0020A05E29|nr:ABC transporter substrate-binding protein [Simiduia sp. 21SJ11W-1]UTA48496.1 ABC transporter substrate-binding protein [Simiduia sp. 21SJ11W-1]
MRLQCRARALGLALLLLVSVPGRGAGIASINLCVDQMLLRFADHRQIASVTYFAANSLMSPHAAAARGLHLNHGLVEEIVPLKPDVVLAGEYGAREAATLLTHLGFQVERVPLPSGLKDIDNHLVRMAELLGKPQALVAHRKAWLERLAEARQANAQVAPGARPVALMLGPNHIAPGAGTLESDLLELAGFQNWAGNKKGFATVDLEQLVERPPDLLIVDNVARTHFSLAHEVLEHPALQVAMARGRLGSLPGNLSVCPAPHINELLSALQALRGKFTQ